LFRPTIVADGRVVGTWSRAARADGILVTPQLFGRLDVGQLADLRDAVRRLGSFLGRDARLDGGPDGPLIASPPSRR
jgi:hypothetical protein